jgi:hypothetical protein
MSVTDPESVPTDSASCVSGQVNPFTVKMAVSATTITAEAVTSRFVRLVIPEKIKYPTAASTVAQIAVWIVLIAPRRRVVDRSGGTAGVYAPVANEHGGTVERLTART